MDPVVRRILTGQATSRQLPLTLDLSVLSGGLDHLCERSLGIAAVRPVEWGACIVLDAGGLRLVHQVSGWPEGVVPLDGPDDHDGYVGFAHVHLPDVVEEKPYLGFSERDFRATVADGDHLSLVCNGPEVFALVRTADCSAPRHRPDDEVVEGWAQLYDEAVSQARRDATAQSVTGRTAGDALDRALWRVNRELCSRLGFAFYRGARGRPLARVFRPFPRAAKGSEWR